LYLHLNKSVLNLNFCQWILQMPGNGPPQNHCRPPPDQAKVTNNTIARYLTSFVNETTLDWELLMLSSNTSFHCSIQNTLFFFTFGLEAHQPSLPGPELCQTFYRDSTQGDLTNCLLLAWDIALRSNEAVTAQTAEYCNWATNPTIPREPTCAPQ
jgi:hypothetical protein